MTMPTTPGTGDGLECAYQGDDEEEDGDEEEETGEREEGRKDEEYVCLPNNGKTEEVQEEEEEQVLCEGSLHVKFVNKPFFSDMKKFPVGFLYHSHCHS